MFHGRDIWSSPTSSLTVAEEWATDVAASELLEGRRGMTGIFDGNLDSAFLSVMILRAEALPFCLGDDGDAGDGSCAPDVAESIVPDRGDIERPGELVAMDWAEREKEEEAYGARGGAGARYASFAGTGGGRSRLKMLLSFPPAVVIACGIHDGASSSGLESADGRIDRSCSADAANLTFYSSADPAFHPGGPLYLD